MIQYNLSQSGISNQGTDYNSITLINSLCMEANVVLIADAISLVF